jgi:hypothetical protein
MYPQTVPALGAITCLALMIFIPLEAWIIGAAGLGVGVIFYLAKKHLNTG